MSDRVHGWIWCTNIVAYLDIMYMHNHMHVYIFI